MADINCNLNVQFRLSKIEDGTAVDVDDISLSPGNLNEVAPEIVKVVLEIVEWSLLNNATGESE